MNHIDLALRDLDSAAVQGRAYTDPVEAARAIRALQAENAALREKAEALEAMEKWLRGDTRRKVASASCTFGKATVVLLCAQCRAPSSTESTLASAIRAALAQAEGKK